LSREEKTRETEELHQEISKLKIQKETVDAETREQANKRDELNEQVRKKRTEASNLKADRDNLNEEVQNLKLQRTALREKIYEKIEEIRGLRPRGKALAELRPPRSHDSLQEEVEGIDWEIQTSILTKEEEKELVEQVRLLETQLAFHRKFERLILRIQALQEEVRAIDAQGKAFHERLVGTARKSQTIHQKMLEKIEESKKAKVDADHFHQLFTQGREKSKAIQSEVAEASKQLRLLKGEISEEETQERRKSAESLRKRLENEAREKLKRGGKLTLDEFKLVAGDNEEKERDQS